MFQGSGAATADSRHRWACAAVWSLEEEEPASEEASPTKTAYFLPLLTEKGTGKGWQWPPPVESRECLAE